jgi:hypothetical protein
MDAVKEAEKAKTDADCGTKEHTPNAVTIAAMLETLDMANGKIPSKGYASLDEMIEALHK